jgi:hypothetical protein
MVDLLGQQPRRRDAVSGRGIVRNGVGEFFGDDIDGGRPVRVRYLWSRITKDAARWEQAFSLDGGRTWETNWVMDLLRIR